MAGGRTNFPYKQASKQTIASPHTIGTKTTNNLAWKQTTQTTKANEQTTNKPQTVSNIYSNPNKPREPHSMTPPHTATLTSSPLVRNHSYRAAVSLNNMAVTLLERGHYETALRTLSDCLTLMRIAFVAMGPSSSLEQQEPQPELQHSEPQEPQHQERQQQQQDYKTIYSSASKRYIQTLYQQQPHPECVGDHRNPHSSRKSKTLKSSFHSVLPCVEVQGLDDQDETIPTLRAAVQYGPTSSLLFPIRLARHGGGATCCCQSCAGAGSCQQSGAEITQQFGIMLYNHGVAQWLVAQQQHHQTKKQEKYLDRCLRSMRMAKKTFLSALYSAAEQEQQEPQPFQDHHDWDSPSETSSGGGGDNVLVLLFLGLTLHVMTVVFQSRQSQQQYYRFKVQEAQLAVQSLCETVNELESFHDASTSSSLSVSSLSWNTPSNSTMVMDGRSFSSITTTETTIMTRAGGATMAPAA